MRSGAPDFGQAEATLQAQIKAKQKDELNRGGEAKLTDSGEQRAVRVVEEAEEFQAMELERATRGRGWMWEPVAALLAGATAGLLICCVEELLRPTIQRGQPGTLAAGDYRAASATGCGDPVNHGAGWTSRPSGRRAGARVVGRNSARG